MPFFLDMPTHQPIAAPIPTTSTCQPLAIAPIASTSLSGIHKIKAMMQNIHKNLQDQSSNLEKKLEDNFLVVQEMRKNMVTLERKQAQNARPF